MRMRMELMHTGLIARHVRANYTKSIVRANYTKSIVRANYTKSIVSPGHINNFFRNPGLSTSKI